MRIEDMPKLILIAILVLPSLLIIPSCKLAPTGSYLSGFSSLQQTELQLSTGAESSSITAQSNTDGEANYISSNIISKSPAIPQKDNTDNRNFNFNGSISKEVLNNYLSKYITFNGLATFAGYGNVKAGVDVDFEDDFRMLKSIGAMFIGRAAHVWGVSNDELHYKDAMAVAKKVHDYNSKIILEAAVFESVYKDNINVIPVPKWVFEAFSLPVVVRNFSYEDMLFPDGSNVNQWGANASVPDITRIETKMWFYYRCKRYIDSGYEAIHLGQLSLISKNDNQKEQTVILLDKIRKYAKIHARRKWVLLSAHLYSQKEGTYQKNDKTYLLLDYHTFPLRPKDVFAGNTTASDGYQPTILEKGFSDSIYGRSAGGINPSGWSCEYNPFVVEFDNSGYDQKNRDTNFGRQWPWGYDEITWFARQPENRRSQILNEFYSWVNMNYDYGNISFPGRIPLAYAFTVQYVSDDNVSTSLSPILIFKANTQSVYSKASFNLEYTMKELWKNPK